MNKQKAKFLVHLSEQLEKTKTWNGTENAWLGKESVQLEDDPKISVEHKTI